MAFKPKLKNKPRDFNFKTREELQCAVDSYFDTMDNDKRPYTIAGLAYFLGVCRATVYNYESREKYSDIISRARERCIMYLEEQLITQGKGGQIFLAKNYGYTDRQEIINTEVKTTDEELWEFENALYED